MHCGDGVTWPTGQGPITCNPKHSKPYRNCMNRLEDVKRTGERTPCASACLGKTREARWHKASVNTGIKLGHWPPAGVEKGRGGRQVTIGKCRFLLGFFYPCILGALSRIHARLHRPALKAYRGVTWACGHGGDFRGLQGSTAWHGFALDFATGALKFLDNVYVRGAQRGKCISPEPRSETIPKIQKAVNRHLQLCRRGQAVPCTSSSGGLRRGWVTSRTSGLRFRACMHILHGSRCRNLQAPRTR
ncbi:unnamed protein product [Symbiodinium natans]|uniref:Uncharacterized protein n=1 Tax=Symbiodinium natans TaxID=878477 RepID=A0A812PBY9_9DINO|nr:unnamed protein product [Symbiodinium natans]